jgi:formylmethanofuran dehydrogenase subunit E
MNVAEALRSVRYDLLEYIQKNVRVDFDNALQMPVCFILGGEKHIVHEVLGRFRVQEKRHVNSFLVKADNEEVYFIYFKWCDGNQGGPLNRVFWVLSFRVLNDRELMFLYREDRRMLLNVTLKRVVDFHGHLCPELVIGGRVCEYAQKFLPDGNFSLLAENCTSAIDAIQVLLGVTFGNQRLKVFDFGRHNYTFLLKDKKKGIRLSLKKPRYGDEDEYRKFWGKITKSEATFNDVVDYQRILDNRIRVLFELNFGDMFDVEEVECTEMPTLYHTCHCCHHEVLIDRAVEYHDNIYCIPCFQSTRCIKHNLQ